MRRENIFWNWRVFWTWHKDLNYIASRYVIHVKYLGYDIRNIIIKNKATFSRTACPKSLKAKISQTTMHRGS